MIVPSARALALAAIIVCACGLHAADREAAVTLDPAGHSWQVVLTGGEYDHAGHLRNAGVCVRSLCGETVWSEFPSSLHPWMVRSGRFAGQPVVLIGVRKPAIFDPVERARPFLSALRRQTSGLSAHAVQHAHHTSSPSCPRARGLRRHGRGCACLC